MHIHDKIIQDELFHNCTAACLCSRDSSRHFCSLAESKPGAKLRLQILLGHIQDQGPVKVDVGGTLVSKGLEVLAGLLDVIQNLLLRGLHKQGASQKIYVAQLQAW